MTETRTDFFKKVFSSDAAGESKILPVEMENSPVTKNYILETRWLADAIKNRPKMTKEIFRVVCITRDSSLILGFTPVYRIYRALEEVYKALDDKKISFTEALIVLLEAVSEKLNAICDLIQKGEIDEVLNTDVTEYLLYLDKALANEIFNASHLVAKKQKPILLGTSAAENADNANAHQKQPDPFIHIHSANIGNLINQQEEMIARSYIIMNQVEILKNAVRENDMRTARDSFKQIAVDTQNLQNSLLISHDQLMTYIKDDAFLKNHKDFQGFFVLANGRKYLIPSEYVEDVVTGSSLDYEEKMNQKYLVYIQENESGTEKTREDIPVYALSSILPGTPEREHAVLDSILIVNFQQHKIGIIVDKMQKFVSLIQKPMPPAFANFPLLSGLAFDEKYDMIPILFMPEIMKKFRAMRPYDVKVFEAHARKQIKKVLIVEDSETTRLIEHTILEGRGFLVEEASDGIEAMTKIKESQFDLILCDDDMPRMDGEIFLDNVRRMENYVKVPVIAVSNTKIPKSDTFISKSDFKRDTLIQKINELFRGEK